MVHPVVMVEFHQEGSPNNEATLSSSCILFVFSEGPFPIMSPLLDMQERVNSSTEKTTRNHDIIDVEENNNVNEAAIAISPGEALGQALSSMSLSSPPPTIPPSDPSPRQCRPRRGEGRARCRERRRGKDSPTEAAVKEVSMKNAVMMLNEMFPPPNAAAYRVTSMSGAPNNPTFSMVGCQHSIPSTVATLSLTPVSPRSALSWARTSPAPAAARRRPSWPPPR